MPVCAREETNGPPGGVDQGFSTGSCSGRHALSARGVHPPTSLFPLILLAQNLSSKQIVSIDNILPKTDNAKKTSSVVKGLMLCKEG